MQSVYSTQSMSGGRLRSPSIAACSSMAVLVVASAAPRSTQPSWPGSTTAHQPPQPVLRRTTVPLLWSSPWKQLPSVYR